VYTPSHILTGFILVTIILPAYLCNENYHAKHLTDDGEIMTIITLLMIYVKNGLVIRKDHKHKQRCGEAFFSRSQPQT
jgi:hypothetical protein